MGGLIWGMLPFAIFRGPFSRQEEKLLEATSRVDMGHISRPNSHVSIAISVTLLLAMTMEIWDCECGPFRPIFAVFAILGHVRNTIFLWGKEPSQRGVAILVVYD